MIDVLATARTAHEVNRVWCEWNGDDSQVHWELAPEWQKASAVDGVRFVLDNPGATDSASHDNWLTLKRNQGWVYGPVKDPDAIPPTHPCMVAFENLPPADQFKDRLFRTVVLSLAEHD